MIHPTTMRSGGVTSALRALTIVGLVALASLSFVVSLALHLDLPACRRAVAAEASDLLATMIRGRVEIASIRSLNLGGVTIDRLALRDPNGALVVEATDVTVSLRPLALARRGTISWLFVRDLKLSLLDDGKGQPTLLAALASKTPSTGRPASTPAFSISTIDVDRLTVHSTLAGRSIDGALAIHRAGISLDASGIHVSLPILDAALARSTDAPEPVQISLRAQASTSGSGKAALLVPHLVLEVRAGSSRGRVEGHFLEGALDVGVEASLTAEDVAIWSHQELARVAPFGTTTLSVHAHGPLDRAVTEVTLSTAVGTLHASGSVNAVARDDELLTSVAIDLHELAPHRLLRDAPDVRFEATSTIDLTRRSGGLSVALNGVMTAKDEADSAWFRAAKLSFSGDARLDGKAAHGVESATVHAKLVRATNVVSVDAAYSNQPSVGGSLEVTSTGALGALDELPAPLAAIGLGGDLTFHGQGGVEIDRRTVRLDATVDAPSLTHGAARVSGVRLDLSVHGALDAPTGRARVSIREARLLTSTRADAPPTLRGIEVVVDAAGDRLHATVAFDTDRAQRLSATFTLDRSQRRDLSVRDVSLRLTRDRFLGLLTVRRIDLKKQEIVVDGARLASTAGGARIDARLARDGSPFAVDIATTDLDVDAFALAAGFERSPVHGTLRVTGKVARAAGTSLRALRGTMEIAAKGSVALPGEHQDPIAFSFDGGVSVERSRAAATAHLTVANLTRLTLDAETSAEDLSALASAPGKIDLERALTFARGLAPASIPGADLLAIRGRLGVEAHLARASRGAPPTLHLRATTTRASLRAKATSLPPLDTQLGVDVTALPGSDGAKIDVTANVSPSGKTDAPFVTATLAGSLPSSLVSKLLSGHVAFPDVEGVAISAQVDIPEQPISRLPIGSRAWLPFGSESSAERRDPSTVAAQCHWEGSISAPKLTLDVALKELHFEPKDAYTATAHATYDGAELRAHASVSTHEGAVEAEVDSSVRVVAAELVRRSSTSKQASWSASLEARARRLPLTIFPFLVDAGITGALDADVHVARFHEPGGVSPDVRATLSVADLAVHGAHFDSLSVDATVDAKGARLDLQARGLGGHLTVQGAAPLDWADGLRPTLPPGALVTLTAKTEAFQLSALAPFVPSLDELDGRLDVDAQLTATAPTGQGGHWSLAPKGTASLRDGILNVNAIGERWEGVEGNVELTGEKLALTKLVLHGRGGRGAATLTGEIDLVATVPTTLTGKIDTDRFALARDGVPIGELSGTVKVTGRLDGSMPKLVAVVDPMTVQLAPSNGKTPQSLAEDPGIHVWPSIAAPVAPSRPSTFALELKVEIPNNVWVRRDDVLVALRGGPTIVLGRAPSIRGEIVLERGKVDVLGKHFDLTRSTATFDGTADMDPTLDLEGTWNAPDDSVVTFKVAGRLSEPKLTFTASPIATDAQIMNLLVLGRRDAGSAADQQSTSAAATAQTTAIAGAMSAAVLGGQLQRILPTAVSLSVRPGTTGLSDARVAAGYQWNRLYFEVGYNAGAQVVAPGAASQSTTTIAVEWRFIDRWSLMTTLGDSGSALVDLLWQFRY